MNTSTSPRRSLLGFHALLLAFSVPFLLAGAVTGIQFPARLPVSSLMAVCPTLAALILVYREAGPEGLRSLWKRAFDPTRIRPIWYLPSILLMPTIALLAYWVIRLTGRPLPEPRVAFVAIPVLFLVFFISAAAEEIGWSGCVLDPVQDRWGALAAGVIIGAVWAAWHALPWVQVQGPAWTAASGSRVRWHLRPPGSLHPAQRIPPATPPFG
jgi:membrane protease YdiL (CAAX protease family)